MEEPPRRFEPGPRDWSRDGADVRPDRSVKATRSPVDAATIERALRLRDPSSAIDRSRSPATIVDGAECPQERSRSMPSPFPGMDPYLESPDWFPDLHGNLIISHERGAPAEPAPVLLRPVELSLLAGVFPAARRPRCRGRPIRGEASQAERGGLAVAELRTGGPWSSRSRRSSTGRSSNPSWRSGGAVARRSVCHRDRDPQPLQQEGRPPVARPVHRETAGSPRQRRPPGRDRPPARGDAHRGRPARSGRGEGGPVRLPGLDPSLRSAATISSSIRSP